MDLIMPKMVKKAYSYEEFKCFVEKNCDCEIRLSSNTQTFQ